MSNMSSTSEIDPAGLAVLRVLATGQLPGRHLLDGELQLLEAEGLIVGSRDDLPAVTSRGGLVLQVANGECAAPLD
jgi:hypothetical protein